MSGDEGDLTPQLWAAIREPNLIIELDRNLFGEGQVLLRLMKPGASTRSKPVQLVPVIIGEPWKQKHSDLLRIIADMLEKSGR